MKIAIVGSGAIGRRHIGNLLRLGQGDLLLVSEHSKRKTFEQDGAIIPIVHTLEEALEQAEAIVIANPSSYHYEYTRQCIDRSRHIYLEKPIALMSEGIDELIQLADDRSLVIAVGTQFRFNPRLLELKEILNEGSLGRILNVTASCGEHIADYHPEEDYSISYAARSELGGGVLLTQIHQIDYLNWLFGGFETVMAAQVDIPELEIDVEGCVSYMMHSRHSCPVSGHLNYVQRPKQTSMEVIGISGKAIWDYTDNRLEIIDNAGKVTTYQSEFDRNQMFLDISRDFIEAIENGRQPRTNLEGGLQALKIVEAIKRSYTSGATARI